jgi:6-methylsalicylic acid synthase
MASYVGHEQVLKLLLDMKDVMDKIVMLEMKGATIHSIALDLSAPEAHIRLQEALD